MSPDESSAASDELVPPVEEAVDILNLATRTSTPIFERNGRGSRADRHSVAAELRQEIQVCASIEPVDVRDGADGRRRPEHECNLRVPAVAEATCSHPAKGVSTHRTADTSVGNHAYRKLSCLNERHPPRRTAESAPIAALPIDIHGEPVTACALRPARDPAMN